MTKDLKIYLLGVLAGFCVGLSIGEVLALLEWCK
jgi:hypothetical protein